MPFNYAVYDVAIEIDVFVVTSARYDVCLLLVDPFLDGKHVGQQLQIYTNQKVGPEISINFTLLGSFLINITAPW